jgi:hypothetical protein
MWTVKPHAPAWGLMRFHAQDVRSVWGCTWTGHSRVLLSSLFCLRCSQPVPFAGCNWRGYEGASGVRESFGDAAVSIIGTSVAQALHVDSLVFYTCQRRFLCTYVPTQCFVRPWAAVEGTHHWDHLVVIVEFVWTQAAVSHAIHYPYYILC